MLPIAFSLFHYVNVHDGSFMMITGAPPIWNDEWKERPQLTIADHGNEKSVDEMVAQRIGDFDTGQRRTPLEPQETFEVIAMAL